MEKFILIGGHFESNHSSQNYWLEENTGEVYSSFGLCCPKYEISRGGQDFTSYQDGYSLENMGTKTLVSNEDEKNKVLALYQEQIAPKAEEQEQDPITLARLETLKIKSLDLSRWSFDFVSSEEDKARVFVSYLDETQFLGENKVSLLPEFVEKIVGMINRTYNKSTREFVFSKMPLFG